MAFEDLRMKYAPFDASMQNARSHSLIFIRLIQSQEQALSALVTARCVLDNFEPALQMLHNDQGLPDGIEPWTLWQVRTLERALAKDYDPNRRLHGWARPGMDMDREDFIDLATVSEQVPGKTPAQVLSFYYRYLAAAEPLTDVVFGPEAAKAREQERICPARKADSVVLGNGRLTKGSVHATKAKAPSMQASSAPRRVRPAETLTNPPEATPKPKPRVIRLSAPKPVESIERSSARRDDTTSDAVRTDDRSTNWGSSPPASDKVLSAPEGTPTPHPSAVSKHAPSEATIDGGDHPAEADRGMRRESDRLGDKGGGRAGVREHFAQQRRCAVREREISRILSPAGYDDRLAEAARENGTELGRAGNEGRGLGGASARFSPQRMCAGREREDLRTILPPGRDDADRGKGRGGGRLGREGKGRIDASERVSPQRRCAVNEREVSRILPSVPPDAEVLEVEDSDDADVGIASQNSGRWPTGGGEPTQPSDMKTVARRVNLTASAGLSWVARQMRRQAASTVEPEPQPSGVRPMPPSTTPRHSNIIEGQIIGDSDTAQYGSRSEAPGFQNARRESRWEQPPISHPLRHEAHARRFDDRSSGGQDERGDIPSSRSCGPGYRAQAKGDMASEPASTDNIFGSMAPCWRLLERAQPYMDKDQLEYMRGLVLTHVRKPMSRDQLLERAESCLQEQDKIFTAFVKMFDGIDQSPQVPLYPTKRTPQPRPPSTPYGVRRLPDAGPIYASPHGLPPPQISPPRAFKAQERGHFSLRPDHDGDERGNPLSAPSRLYPRAAVPTSGRLQVRPSIHPYDHNGASGWRVGGFENSGSSDVGTRAEPPSRRRSPGPHPSDPCVNSMGYREGRSDMGSDGDTRMQNEWKRQRPMEWKTETGSSAAAAAAAPGSMARSGSKGPAWGGSGTGAWS